MDKAKTLTKIDELIATGEQIIDALRHANSRNCRGCEKCRTAVENFENWKQEINLFLGSNPKFQLSHAEFEKKITANSRIPIAKRYIPILQSLRKSIDEGIIQLDCSPQEPPDGVKDKNKQFLWLHIPDNIKKLYDDGHYQQAVFESFKYVETQVRSKGNYPETLIGTDLMRTAFNVENGNLTKQGLPKAEKQAQSDLFAGAIGFIKNPKSHHNVNVHSDKAIELIYFANYLLRILDGDYSERE